MTGYRRRTLTVNDVADPSATELPEYVTRTFLADPDDRNVPSRTRALPFRTVAVDVLPPARSVTVPPSTTNPSAVTRTSTKGFVRLRTMRVGLTDTFAVRVAAFATVTVVVVDVGSTVASPP